MEEALIGLTGLLVGMLITEHFRKRSRIENFSAPIFEKRLSVYEGLMAEFQLACGVVNALYEDTSSTLEERSDIAFGNGLKLMEFTDDKSFYLNEEVTVHIGMLFVGVSDIFDSEKTDKEREELYKDFSYKVGETKRLIKLASGITTIDQLITNITKSQPESNYIKHFRRIKKEHESKKSI